MSKEQLEAQLRIQDKARMLQALGKCPTVSNTQLFPCHQGKDNRDLHMGLFRDLHTMISPSRRCQKDKGRTPPSRPKEALLLTQQSGGSMMPKERSKKDAL